MGHKSTHTSIFIKGARSRWKCERICSHRSLFNPFLFPGNGPGSRVAWVPSGSHASQRPRRDAPLHTAVPIACLQLTQLP